MTNSTLEPGSNSCNKSTEEINLYRAEQSFRAEANEQEGREKKLNLWYNEWRKQAHLANTSESVVVTFRSAFNLLDAHRAISEKGFRTKEALRYLEEFLHEQAKLYASKRPGLIHQLQSACDAEIEHIFVRLYNLDSVVDEYSLAKQLNWTELPK